MTLKSPSYEYTAQEKHELLHEMSRYEIDQTAGERQLLAILASGDRSSDIARITAPTLVIHGEDDPLLPLAAGRKWPTSSRNLSFWPCRAWDTICRRFTSRQLLERSPLTFGRRKPRSGFFLGSSFFFQTHLTNLVTNALFLKHAQVVYEDRPFQMIHFVLNTDSQQPVAFQFKKLPSRS